MNELESEIKRVFCSGHLGEEEPSIENLKQVPPEALDHLVILMIMFDSYPLLKFIIERGANVNNTDSGVSPLLYACQQGQLDAAKLLVEAGADLSAVCERGFSPLIYAVKSLSLPMVEWVVELGFDLNQRDNRGLTVLHAVVSSMNAKGNGEEPRICEIIQFLLSKGAIVTDEPVSPAMFAQGNNLMKAAELLDGNVPKPRFFDSNVPMWLLYPEFIHSLIERGADLNERNKDGETPLSLSLSRGLIEQANLFIEYGSDVHFVDEDGLNIFHLLGAFNSGPEAVTLTEKLIGMGLDVNRRCPNGSTPLSWSNLFKEGSDVSEVIKRHGGVV